MHVTRVSCVVMSLALGLAMVLGTERPPLPKRPRSSSMKSTPTLLVQMLSNLSNSTMGVLATRR